MSDVNASVMAVDDAIDLLTKYGMEFSNVHARGCFEITSIAQLVASKKYENQTRIEELCAEMNRESHDEEHSGSDMDMNEQAALLQKLQTKQEHYNVLLERVTAQCDIKLESWNKTHRYYLEFIENGKRIMGEYIFQLNKIIIGEGRTYESIHAKPGYYVIVVDSKRYPQTAEHIRFAIKKGMPDFVTLGREGAADRRTASLRGIKTRPEYDRDEWPMACFAEGGNGADVWYINRRDNRGAGSSIGWQMRGIPDGSKVRLRII